jgi:anti-anti-sigma factor
MPVPPDRHVRLETTDTGLTAQLIDCRLLDEQSTPAIEAELFGLTEQLGAGTLFLDLAGLDFMSSVGLGMLIGLHRCLKASGGHLVVLGVSADIYELIEVTGLTRLLDVRRNKPSDA